MPLAAAGKNNSLPRLQSVGSKLQRAFLPDIIFPGFRLPCFHYRFRPWLYVAEVDRPRCTLVDADIQRPFRFRRIHVDSAYALRGIETQEVIANLDWLAHDFAEPRHR